MKKSSTYDSFIADKANTGFARRLRELSPDAETTARLRDYLGVSSQAINQFKLGTSYPKTENLVKIAEHFGVSVDYLLGLSDVPNKDERIQGVSAVTGLSLDAICKLNDFVKCDDGEFFAESISAIIAHRNSAFIMRMISSLKECYNAGTAQELVNTNIAGVEASLTTETHLKSILELKLFEFINDIAEGR